MLNTKVSEILFQVFIWENVLNLELGNVAQITRYQMNSNNENGSKFSDLNVAGSSKETRNVTDI